MATPAPTVHNPLARISYDDLYARWERGNWRATELDFSEDRRHWQEQFSDLERRAALWNYAMFFVGEDSVARNLSPYIDAAPTEEQKYFLATQQVDEARHSVFFARFMREVVGIEGSLSDALEANGEYLTWGFRETFKRLDRMAEELRSDRSRPKFAQAITLYHLVIEAGLAQPGQHFIESYLDERKVLPGFHAGMRNVSLDEQRHIGFGVKTLSELILDEECREAVISFLREMLPQTGGVFIPPNWDRSYTECFGFTLEEIYAQGFESLETKLRTAGFKEEEVRRALTSRMDLQPIERAERIIKLLKAGIIGQKNGPPARDPETLELFFDSIRNAVDMRHAPPHPVTIQWDFRDAQPWHLRLANGSTSVAAGHAPDPDLTFRCRFEDWVDVAMGRTDPRLALARGRLRPRGSLRLLWRMPKLFG